MGSRAETGGEFPSVGAFLHLHLNAQDTDPCEREMAEGVQQRFSIQSLVLKITLLSMKPSSFSQEEIFYSSELIVRSVSQRAHRSERLIAGGDSVNCPATKLNLLSLICFELICAGFPGLDFL